VIRAAVAASVASEAERNEGRMRAAFHTFGCKLNQYETESLASTLSGGGFTLVSPAGEAEVYVINTCTVTSRSEQKARRYIRGLARRHGEALLVVTGCYAQLNREELQALAGNVLVVPQEQKALLLKLPEFVRAGGELRRDPASRWLLREGPGADGDSPPNNVFDFQVERFSFHSRAFLKIQDGCDYSCSYCRVPLARGRSVSLAAEEVLLRAGRLEGQGYRELVLTGVNICAYRDSEIGLPGLLAKLLAGTTTARLRLSSLEPERVDEELAAGLSHERVCSHFHLPVQSGSDAVLLRMRRRYRSERVRKAVHLLRQCKDDPFLAADVMVGFPGESDADFLATRDLIEETGFSRLHVFPFSPRPGTRALTMRGRVAERVRDRRSAELIGLSQRLHDRYVGRWEQREVEVVLETAAGRADGAAWQGLSGNYLRVVVEGVPVGSAGVGSLVRARVQRCGDPCVGRYLGIL
jgi:threonylcarbamoyladenosine tRNA methylthiotransferase MtaB